MKKIIPPDCVLVPDDAKLAFKGMIFDVYQWPQELYDGTMHTFEMLKRTDTVNAICIVDDQVLVLDDEQPHLGARLSFPGGRVDPKDTTIEESIVREVHEETGYSFDNWRLVKVVQQYRKIEWFVYTWVAWGVRGKDEPHVDPGEKITVRMLTLEELKKTINNANDYLSESRDIFARISTLEDLYIYPEYSGIEIDR